MTSLFLINTFLGKTHNFQPRDFTAENLENKVLREYDYQQQEKQNSKEVTRFCSKKLQIIIPSQMLGFLKD